ncbi:two-component system, sensor histidine kinase YesM [Paenibacillus catalpae]|uniref:histidine kinase n=1 Tax=Paenibacillus catalpae TaxID=1045775 RepID=A0A1I2BAP2_9BACL|nr:histidine kinase [Paenibacillus catalpae]SFE53282.1 two-component system, sensor histidine kinase YesM [Paenibacillus catalpae]
MRKIKNKILGSVILIVTLSLTAISILAYESFSSILEAQALKEDTIHLEQTNNQLNQLIDDVQKYAANMVNDELLLKFASKTEYPSVYDELSAYRDVVTQLTKFNVLRDYLQSSAIVRSDGRVFWSALYLDPYFEQLLLEDWFTDATANSVKSGFTAPHFIQDQGPKKVVTFFIRFDPEYGGMLLLNIDYSAFSDLFDYLSLSFDKVAWVGPRGSVMYNHGWADTTPPLPSAEEEGRLIVKQQDNAYQLTGRLDKTEWSVVTFTSKDRFYEWLGDIIKYWAVFVALCVALCFVMFLPIISSIVRPISQMSKAMKQVSMGNLQVSLTFRSNDELSVLGSGFQTMIGSLRRQMAEREEQERRNRKMSAELLFAQINPHFIYNTLNTVVYLARKGNREAIEEMVESFIGILQDAVHIGETGQYVAVEQEIELIDHYVRIQRYRYTERFRLEWETEEQAKPIRIPKSLIQPLVENAIFHGFAEKESQGLIRISVRLLGERIQIKVRDNGCGMATEIARAVEEGSLPSTRRPSGGMRRIGLRNIRERIDYLYGEAGRMTVQSREGQGTVITIELPASGPSD